MAKKGRLQTVEDAFRNYFQQQGWSILREKEIAHGRQLVVTDGLGCVPVDCYNNGNAYIQGPPCALKTHLQEWWHVQKTPLHVSALWETNTNAAEYTSEQSIPVRASVPQLDVTEGGTTPHIGTDEAGKGDYFGPLVVAGVYVTDATATRLRALGVRDSKLLSDDTIRGLAEEIKTLCRGYGHVICYRPERYNQLYHSYLNLNIMLAEAHAQVIADIQHEVSCDLAVVDQFSEQPLVLDALRKIGCQIKLGQRTHAESDIAVAAASIIARAEFVRQVEELSRSLHIRLPLGASHAQIVPMGREIVTRYGRDALGKAAKLHFRLTQEVLQK